MTKGEDKKITSHELKETPATRIIVLRVSVKGVRSASQVERGRQDERRANSGTAKREREREGDSTR